MCVRARARLNKKCGTFRVGSGFYSRRQHPQQQRLRLLLLLDELRGSLRDGALQVVGVFLHHRQHVVEDVGAPAWKESGQCKLCTSGFEK